MEPNLFRFSKGTIGELLWRYGTHHEDATRMTDIWDALIWLLMYLIVPPLPEHEITEEDGCSLCSMRGNLREHLSPPPGWRIQLQPVSGPLPAPNISACILSDHSAVLQTPVITRALISTTFFSHYCMPGKFSYLSFLSHLSTGDLRKKFFIAKEVDAQWRQLRSKNKV